MTSKIASNLSLGLLVSVLSILTAAANYLAFQAGDVSSGFTEDGDRALAKSNTLYLEANQEIIVDYNMYDAFYVQQGLDTFASDYYREQFSYALESSIERNGLWDDQYYDEMYAKAEEKYEEAETLFEKANAAGEREAGFQLAMLIAALGLAFAAYASLLEENNRLRAGFALLSYVFLVFDLVRFVMVLAS